MSEAKFTQIASKRLILSRFKDSDLASFMAYRNDPMVARYQSWDSCDEQQARAFIREMESAQPSVPGEWFQFAIESEETQDLIRDCGLRVDEDESYRAEIGFTLAQEHQGKGFASEAVSRLLDYTFDTLGAPSMEISSARTPTVEDRPREMHRRPPGPPHLTGDQLTRIEDFMNVETFQRRQMIDATLRSVCNLWARSVQLHATG